MKKQYKSPIFKNHKITQKKLFLDFAPEIKKKHCGNIH